MHRERELGLLLSPLLLTAALRAALPAAAPVALRCDVGAMGRDGDWVACGGGGPLAGGEARVLGLPLDLNRATAAELDGLPAVGPLLAERIVRLREAEGPFRSVGDLLRVPGIGEGKLRVLRGRVAVGGKVEP